MLLAIVAVAALAAAAAHRVGVAAAASLRARSFERLEDGSGGIILLHGRRGHGGRSGEDAAQWRRWRAPHIHVATRPSRHAHFRGGHVILHVGHRVATFRHICAAATCKEKSEEKVYLVGEMARKMFLASVAGDAIKYGSSRDIQRKCDRGFTALGRVIIEAQRGRVWQGGEREQCVGKWGAYSPV